MFGPNVKKLVEAGDVSGLVSLAVNSRRKKSEQAFYALTQLLPESALPSLTKELQGEKSDRSLAAAFAIGAMVERGGADACEAACRGLQDVRECEAATPLLEGLAHADHAEAADAVIAFLNGPLSPLERPRSPLEIEPRLERKWSAKETMMGAIMAPDTREDILVAAFEVLTRLRDPRATTLFMTALRWRDPAVEAFDAELLAEGSLSVDSARVHNADMRVRCAAARGLGEVPSHEAEAALREVLHDKSERDDVRKAAKEALAKCASAMKDYAEEL